MNIQSRLKKIESNIIPPLPCLCGKTWVDLMFRGKSGARTFCRNCKDQFDQWRQIADEAKNGENLTDEVRI